MYIYIYIYMYIHVYVLVIYTFRVIYMFCRITFMFRVVHIRTVEQIWHMLDNQGQILDLTFRYDSLKCCKISSLRSEALNLHT